MGDGGRPAGIETRGWRIFAVKMVGRDGQYHDLDPEGTYTVAVNDFIAAGGDGFCMFDQAETVSTSKNTLKDILASDLQAFRSITPIKEGRILFFQWPHGILPFQFPKTGLE
jgi:2',3'-cyclic-nucleotide 2'-phosphodiesterase (5'-nucleotidase family)